MGLLRVVPVWGPAMGLSLAGPSGVGLGLRALRLLACVDPVTDASGFPYRASFDWGLGWCTGAVSCGPQHLPLRVGGRHARVPCVCARARPSWHGQAGRPPRRVLVCLTFFFGRMGLLLCSAPSGLGLPLSWSVFLFFPLLVSARACCLLRSLVSGPGCLGPWRLVFLSSPPRRLVFFFPAFLLRPCSLWLSCASGPGCPGPRRCVLFVLLYRLKVLCPSLCVSLQFRTEGPWCIWVQNMGRACGMPLVQIQTCCPLLVPNLQNCFKSVLSNNRHL